MREPSFGGYHLVKEKEKKRQTAMWPIYGLFDGRVSYYLFKFIFNWSIIALQGFFVFKKKQKKTNLTWQTMHQCVCVCSVDSLHLQNINIPAGFRARPYTRLSPPSPKQKIPPRKTEEVYTQAPTNH